MEEKENLEAKENNNKIALYVLIVGIIIIVGIITGFVIKNKSLDSNCGVKTGNIIDDKELCQKCTSSDFPCDYIYNSRQQIEKYGFNENATINNNLDLFTEHLVDIISSPNDEFKSLSEINNNLLYYLLMEYVRPNECGWVNKSLYKEAYKEIFNNELDNIDNIYFDKEVNTTNYFLSCTGRGSTIIPEFLSKNINGNYIEYNYKVEFIDDDKEYSLVVQYKKENNNYYLSSVLINDLKEDKSDIAKSKFGDLVELIKLSSVKDYYEEGDVQDFSKWYVLENETEYIVLISSKPFGKVTNDKNIDISSVKSLLEKEGIQFGENGYVRLLNENDLTKYFDCNLTTMKCSKKINGFNEETLTSAVKDDEVIIFNFAGILDSLEEGEALVYMHPVIKILKSNINN